MKPRATRALAAGVPAPYHRDVPPTAACQLPWFLPLAVACGTAATSPADWQSSAPAVIAVLAGEGQSAQAGTALAVEPRIRVLDQRGRPIRGESVSLHVSGGGWVPRSALTTGSDGSVTTAWYLGPDPDAAQTLAVRAGTLTVTITADAIPLRPGDIHFGREAYIEFQVGDDRVILSAGHGGSLTPAEIPDRPFGTTTTDLNTDPLARTFAAALLAQSGRRPHLVISRLRRTKLDPNREIGEAAAGNRWAEWAWREYHGFLEAARHAAAAAWGHALYLDLHGHAHPAQRLELGYLLDAAQLAQADHALDMLARASSVRALAAMSPHRFADLLRGAVSLGGLLEAQGFPAVPAPATPAPGTDPYFEGGYSTRRHGSRDGGTVSAIQIEAHWTGARDSPQSRARLAAALATATSRYLAAHLDHTALLFHCRLNRESPCASPSWQRSR